MLSLKRWVRGLWAWWAISALLVLGLIATGWFFSLSAFWSQTDAGLEPKIRALVAAFAAVSDKQSTLVLELREAVMTKTLEPSRLQSARQAAAPFFRLYYVDAKGHPVWPGDPAAPAWMVSQAATLQPGTMQVFRPQPPGLDIDMTVQAEPPPADFLVATLRGPATSLMAEADLDYIFGPWLQEQCRLIDVGRAVARRIDHEVLWRDMPAEGAVQGKVDLNARGSHWTRRLTVFPTQSLWPFDAVELSLDVGPELSSVQHNWAMVFAACLCVLGGFALSLRLAAAAIRRDFAAAHVRANFTAMVSHELKTPVAAICLTTEILQHKLVDDPAKIDEYHILLHKEALRLRRLIDNVMRLFGLGGQPALEPTDVAGVVQQALEEGQDVAVEVAPGIPPALMDRDAAVRAIANLVENAFKYGGSPSDIGIHIHEIGRHVVVDVMDRGPGIPRRLRQAVFEPYFRMQDEERRDKPGTGLGLALVKIFMERQAGNVRILDRPGGGTIFRLSFRRAS